MISRIPDRPAFPGAAPTVDAMTSTPSASRGHSVAAQADFARTLGRSIVDAKTSPKEQARDAAEQFVASVFVQPVLQQLRESSEAAPPFEPSQGERMFQSMLDQTIARNIVRSTNWPLVERITSDLLARSVGQEVRA